MAKLIVFNHVSLDGYFTDANGDMRWAHRNNDAESKAFEEENAKGGGMLLFGRVTYQMMASYWPTPMAAANDAVVAERMNQLPKVVFSRTLDKASWNNTTLLKGNLAAEIRRLKAESGPDMATFGSGNLISQLAQQGLVDEYQMMVNPIILGKGRTLFEGVKEKLALKLTKTRTFNSGNVFMCYQPV